MAKEVAALIKLQIKGGAANPSPPVGPALGAKGVNIMEKWDAMVHNYYTLMGWNPDTGAPLPDTLKRLDLMELV